MTGLVRVKGWIYRMQIRLSQLDFPNLCLISTSFLCKAEKGLWFYLSSLIYMIWIHPYIRSVISVFSNVIQRSILASLQRHLTLSTISKCFCQNPLCVPWNKNNKTFVNINARRTLSCAEKKGVKFSCINCPTSVDPYSFRCRTLLLVFARQENPEIVLQTTTTNSSLKQFKIWTHGLTTWRTSNHS